MGVTGDWAPFRTWESGELGSFGWTRDRPGGFLADRMIRDDLRFNQLDADRAAHGVKRLRAWTQALIQQEVRLRLVGRPTGREVYETDASGRPIIRDASGAQLTWLETFSSASVLANAYVTRRVEYIQYAELYVPWGAFDALMTEGAAVELQLPHEPEVVGVSFMRSV